MKVFISTQRVLKLRANEASAQGLQNALSNQIKSKIKIHNDKFWLARAVAKLRNSEPD
jgi:hypothetical protein